MYYASPLLFEAWPNGMVTRIQSPSGEWRRPAKAYNLEADIDYPNSPQNTPFGAAASLNGPGSAYPSINSGDPSVHGLNDVIPGAPWPDGTLTWELVSNGAG